jgi:NAD-dependent DNA ligase
MNLSGGGRLVDCCEERGIPFTGSAHSALDDARAAGRLLTHLLAHDRARTREVEALEPISWPNLRGRGKPPLSRAESKARRERSPTFLQALMSRLRGARTPGSPESDVVADQDLLNCALEDRLIDVATSTALAGVAAERGLAGKTVCFTGEMQQHYRGMPISRDRAQELARSAGLLVADSVTKKLDILVVADALTQSGKAQKARTYGTRILHERMFWRAIGVEVN